ncbi:M16 family metallopeptidase [Rickettsiales bacterium LUAb2]
MSNCKIYKMKNGLTIVVDHIPHVETVCIGMFAGVGSRIENINNSGICHFLEHMVFKGTKKRNMYDISEHIENRGGYINAWTSKDKTAWYAKMMKEDAILALEVIIDILRNSVFPEDEIEKEKSVVIQEIKQSKDNPDDIIYSHFQNLCYAGNSLSFDILGTEENISAFTQKDLINQINKYYTPNNMVLSVVGNIDADSFVKEASYLFDGWAASNQLIKFEQATLQSGKEVIVKPDLFQTQIITGYKSVSFNHQDFYKHIVFSSILGAGMSSRLFKEIREKRGLVYHIDSSISAFNDVGSLNIQAACEREKAKEVIQIIHGQIEVLANENVNNQELQKVKKQLISGIYMSLESSYGRAERWAKNILNFNKIIEVSEIVDKINNITSEDVIGIASELLTKEPVVAVLSNQNIDNL